MSRVLIITTSLRPYSNSDRLAEEVRKGAELAGHDTEVISLKGKRIRFCMGCFACQKTQKCVLNDDAVTITEEVKESDILVFATPIYYYGISGQMKTLLDRLNPLYTADYRFRNVYLLTTAAEDEAFVPEKAVSTLEGWVDCFKKAKLAGSLFLGGVTETKEAEDHLDALKEAYEFGKNLS